MVDYNVLIKYDNKDGTYCLLFKNQHALEREEIKEIFSQFGFVHNIRIAGDHKGYWFIRYKSWNEAKRAVDDLINHPKIKLSKHHHKQNYSRASDRSQNSDQEQQECDGARFIQQFNKTTKSKIDQSGYGRNENFKENEYHGNFNNNSNDLPWGPKSANGNEKQNDQLRRSNSCQENYDGLPDLVDRNMKAMLEEQQDQKDEIPELVTSDGKTLKTCNPVKKVIPAQEVIVANINPKFGAPYILHLFDHYEPLAITNIKIEPKTAKRYCHVYFKTAEQSQQVETFFDKTSLLDQKLVVIRSSQLVESAY